MIGKKQVIAPSSLPDEIVEEIFLRLSVKTLLRFKSLSKQWTSTIESQSFVARQLKIAKRSHMDHPKLMFISQQLNGEHNTKVGFETICQESGSRLSFAPFDFPKQYHIYHSESCDGLFCIYSLRSLSIYVINPATQWFRKLPPTRSQILTDRAWRIQINFLALVKAADYKLVLLYNSSIFNSDALSPDEGVTKCEVFDFRANAWRYLTYTPSYKIFYPRPVSVNGSIYWYTESYNAEVKVVGFDIHTEKFRLLPKIHHQAIASFDRDHIHMCTLDSCLCMSIMCNEKEKVIWRLKKSEDLWEKIFTIDLLSCPTSPKTCNYRGLSLTPVAICKKKILILHRDSFDLVKYDPQTKTFSEFVTDSTSSLPWQHLYKRRYVPYFQSLISHI